MRRSGSNWRINRQSQYCVRETIGTALGDRRFFSMSRPLQIVAIGLLTQRDLALLGRGFDRAFPVDPTPCFEDLIKAIDNAERTLQHADGREPTET